MPHNLSLAMRTSVRRCLLAAVAVLPALAGSASNAADKTQPPVRQATQAPAAQQTTGAAAPVGQPAGAPAGERSPMPMAGQADPVVASVEGHPIYLSDLGRAEEALPSNLRNMPFEALYPVLVDRMVDHEALVMIARRMNLEDDPGVKKQIEEATERVLEGALLARTAAVKVTEQAIKQRYDELYANRPATEQVRASHILVETKAQALKLIAQLKNGADFAELAKKYSKDPDGQKGGELGFFSREQVWPGFADVAFSLQPGQVASEPIHNEFGWHVVKVEERRLLAPPSYTQAHDAIRQQLLQEAIRAEVARARAQLDIHEWNLDGTPLTPAATSEGTAANPN